MDSSVTRWNEIKRVANRLSLKIRLSDNQTINCNLRVQGEHFAYSLLAVAAVVQSLRLDLSKLPLALKNFSVTKGRAIFISRSIGRSDPAMKILEVAAWRELLLRERINEAVKSNLLKFATGNDLDNLAEFHGVEREKEKEEKDERFRERIKAKIVAGVREEARNTIDIKHCQQIEE
ncbi:UDP-N-acetylmuramoyl-tripeptide--D-alanyl-D-alanine ligase [Trichonephila clavata]|uniref:UDP-N-acetylmuramoyl-tripeptide--D-alanyl-D-alanine ligase n=1 Tax=Trichonephila clavata TaxID=2740835 RepID=A0A8X6IQL2_TRICU|nr:UDP-N-acetylmuramoyl-tripeptide--D-alanyl-D-alanine ligase [Trichonephila clavata]